MCMKVSIRTVYVTPVLFASRHIVVGIDLDH